ncbi:MAG: flagellar biosynthesis protein FlhA [Armatimonadetes bacterium]|nr:flagellar biosynthesis protein FlhA [Armatimonadota bacterium]
MTWVRRLSQSSDFAIAGVLLLMTAMLIVPLPPLMVDVLLIANVAFAMVTLLMTTYVTDPLQFSVFPSLLLASTLLRLGLNVSLARLILTQGNAGAMVAAFGGLVVGGNVIIGLVVFAILLIIQFLVITNGAGRMAEVAARFTLDAMPGKQMSIDAELNAGAINEEQARERRRQVERQADFFGAMDGASKFVRGDAIAGLLITVVNLLGGFGVGMVLRGMSPGEAMQTFALQAVGAGLVIQIPALLISAASGLILTRTAATAHLGADMMKQLLARWEPLAAAAAIVGILGLFPGLPKLPFLLGAGILGTVAWAVRAPAPQKEAAPGPPPPPSAAQQTEQMHALAEVDAISVEVGYGLIGLVEVSQGGDLLDRIVMIRRQTAQNLGLIIPPVRVRDNPHLSSRDYRVTIRGAEVARAEIIPTGLLAIKSAADAPPLPGVLTTDPAFGAPAVWISEAERPIAQMAGYQVVEPTVVIATHLGEIVRRHGWRLLSRQEVQGMLDRLKERHKAVVEELVPGIMSVGDVQKILQATLREGVPIKDLVTILETLADCGRTVKEVDKLVEAVRRAMGRNLYQHLLDEQHRLAVMTLDAAVEQRILDAAQAARPIDMDLLRQLQAATQKAWEQATAAAASPVLLCSSVVRPAMRQLLESTLPNLAVVAYEELDPAVNLHRLGTVEIHAGKAV